MSPPRSLVPGPWRLRRARLLSGALLAILIGVGAALAVTRGSPASQPETPQPETPQPPPYAPPAPPTVPRLELPIAEGSGVGGRGPEGCPPSPVPCALSPVFLTDRSWRSATTGWQVLADFDTPLVNHSFTWGEMVVAGEPFSRGISTYPFSEIVYDLQGHALRFQARIGVTDDSKDRAGSARFYVYGDEFLLQESGVVRAGELARSVDLAIGGISELRLVVDDAGDGSLGDYALWGDPLVLYAGLSALPRAQDERPAHGELVEPQSTVLSPGVAAVQGARAARLAADDQSLAAERATLAAIGTAHAAALERVLGPGGGRGLHGDEVRGGFDAASSMLVLGSDRGAAALGFGGSRSGRLTLSRCAPLAASPDPTPHLLPASGVRMCSYAPTLVDAMPTLLTADGRTLRLSDMRPESPQAFTVRPVNDRFDGRGQEASARFRPDRGPGSVTIALTAWDGPPAYQVRIHTEGLPLRRVRYLDPDAGALIIGDRAHYLTDRSHLYLGEVRRDGHLRRAPLEATKPALLWSEADGRGVLLTFFDYAPSPAWISMRAQPGLRSAALGVDLEATLDDFGPAGATPPALTIELTDHGAEAETFARFRRGVKPRYPADPWPPAARYQWGSWYAYGPGVNAASLLRQVELLASSFTDLGPWQLLIDAGWHLQYGREDAEPTAVDFEKFPGGVRAVADAAHARGLQVLLYLGTGFIHDSPGDGGEWLALRGLIERHPNWLLPFQHESSAVRRYLLDYRNPEVRAYIAGILRDFFQVHGVDGVLADGLADAEGQLIPRIERDRPNGPAQPLLPSLEIYRLFREEVDRHRHGAFITNGWVNPTAANPFAQIFYYGDEGEGVDTPYPFAGFLQKLDYALYSRKVVGQRVYAGSARGDPLLPETRWWVQAGAALGVPATLSFDLGRLDPGATAAFRADLRALDPYQGTTTFGPGLLPETFATTRDGVTYLGIVNREARPRAIRVALAPLGLGGHRYSTLDVSAGRGSRVEGDFDVELPAKSFRLLALRRGPGVLWTDSVVRVETDTPGTTLVLAVRGPAPGPGFLYLAVPRPREVLMDGVSLRPGAAAPGQYAYDEASGLLHLAYSHAGDRRIEVRH